MSDIHDVVGKITSPEWLEAQHARTTAPRTLVSRFDQRGLRLITLHVARCADYPEGSSRCGYAFVAPLDGNSRLDTDAWHEQRERCYALRFWEGEPDRVGHLVHRRGGSGGATWCFEYDDVLGSETEPGHHLQTHRFLPGDYVSIRQEDELKTFKVADVRRACAR